MTEKQHAELHVELDEKLTLMAAHERVTALESDIRASVPEISSILTHIESEPATVETSDEIVQDTTAGGAAESDRRPVSGGG